jgi:hypothetical protein
MFEWMHGNPFEVMQGKPFEWIRGGTFRTGLVNIPLREYS